VSEGGYYSEENRYTIPFMEKFLVCCWGIIYVHFVFLGNICLVSWVCVGVV